MEHINDCIACKHNHFRPEDNSDNKTNITTLKTNATRFIVLYMDTWGLRSGCQTIDKVGRFRLPLKSFVQHRTRSILVDKIGQRFEYRPTDFVYVSMVIVYSGRWVFILVFLFRLLLSNVYFRSLDAEQNSASIVLWSAFCCCVSVKLADIVPSCKRDKIGQVLYGSTIISADFLGRLNHAHKSWPTLSTVQCHLL